MQPFRFLFGLYRLNTMWTEYKKEHLAAQGSELERVVIDHDFVDLTQPHRVLHKFTSTGVAALEVHLQGSAATELLRKEVPPRHVMRDARFRPEDVEAEKVMSYIISPMEGNVGCPVGLGLCQENGVHWVGRGQQGPTFPAVGGW